VEEGAAGRKTRLAGGVGGEKTRRWRWLESDQSPSQRNEVGRPFLEDRERKRVLDNCEHLGSEKSARLDGTGKKKVTWRVPSRGAGETAALSLPLRKQENPTSISRAPKKKEGVLTESSCHREGNKEKTRSRRFLTKFTKGKGKSSTLEKKKERELLQIKGGGGGGTAAFRPEDANLFVPKEEGLTVFPSAQRQKTRMEHGTKKTPWSVRATWPELDEQRGGASGRNTSVARGRKRKRALVIAGGRKKERGLRLGVTLWVTGYLVWRSAGEAATHKTGEKGLFSPPSVPMGKRSDHQKKKKRQTAFLSTL